MNLIIKSITKLCLINFLTNLKPSQFLEEVKIITLEGRQSHTGMCKCFLEQKRLEA